MSPYFLIATFLLFLGLSKEFPNRYISNRLPDILAFTLLLLAMGGSLSRGDYGSYVDLFESIDKVSFLSSFEWGFLLLAKTIKFFTDDSFYFFFYATLIALIVQFFALLKFKINIPAYCFIYFCGFAIHLNFGSLRFGIASSFLLLSLVYIIKERFKLFAICIILGASFHLSLLVALPLYIICMRPKYIAYLLLMGLTWLLIWSNLHDNESFRLLLSHGIGVRLFSYLRFGTFSPGLSTIRHFGVLFIFAYYFKKDLLKNMYFRVLFIAQIYGFICILYFWPNRIIASRYSLLFSIGEPILLAFIAVRIKDLYGKILLYTVVILLSFVNLRYSLVTNSNEVNLYLPYKNVFLGDSQEYTDPTLAKQNVESDLGIFKRSRGYYSKFKHYLTPYYYY